MKRACLLLVCVAIGLIQQVPRAAAQDDVLKSIPKDAFVVIRFSSTDQFIGSVKDMLGGISPLAAAVGGEFEAEFYNEMLSLDGGEQAINRKAPVYAVAFPYFDKDEPVAVFLEVKDQDAFRKGLKLGDEDADLKVEKRDDGFEKVTRGNRSYFLAQRGKYTVYTQDEDIVRRLSLANAKMNSLADALPAREKKLFAKGEASIAVNIAPVVAKYKDELNGALDEANKAIDALPDEQLGTASPEATKKFYKQMAKLSFDAAFDAQWAVASAKLNAKGAAVDSLLTFKKNSGTDKLIAANPARDMQNLSLLPAGAPFYGGFAFENDEWFGQWLRSNYGDNPDNAAAIDKAFKKMLDAGAKSTVFSYSLPNDDKTGLVAVSIEEAKDAKALREGWHAYMSALGKVENPLFTQTMSVKKNAEKHKGYDIDLTRTKIELGDLEVAAIVGGLFKRIFGGDVFEARMARVENLLVQATGNDPGTIRKLLDSFESGEGYVGLEAEFGKTRDQLGQNSNLTMLIDLPGMIVDGIAMIRDLEPFSEGLEMLPFNFGVSPPASYSGFSLGTQPQAIQMKLYVPVKQPRGMLQIFGPSL